MITNIMATMIVDMVDVAIDFRNNAQFHEGSMRGVLMKLVLNGGGVGKAVESARKLLNGIIDHNKKILYVPFAWPDPTFSGCLKFMTDELSDIDKAGIEMVKTPEELMGKDFCEYACLYIGGGNTYKLLDCLKKSGAFEKIRRYLLEDDGIVYGGSAGAIIFGKDLEENAWDTRQKREKITETETIVQPVFLGRLPIS